VGFTEVIIDSWKAFDDLVLRAHEPWIYRGQPNDWDLTTSLERALIHWSIDLSKAPKIEQVMIRDFRRQYRGARWEIVSADTFFCLALMQHHGAPTRLLDFTYSPFVAAKFATDVGAKNPVIWCFRANWYEDQAKEIAGKTIIENRSKDKFRTEDDFLRLYMGYRQKQFVLGENPIPLNERLIQQQGIFLCPGDISASLLKNIEMKGWESTDNIYKIRLLMTSTEKRNFAEVLRKMNVSSSVLFPGLDGFTKAFGERLTYFENLVDRDIG
jgi:hypothetical protein